MQPRPSFDRALLIPIAIGVVSILGIGWILFTSTRGESPIPPTAMPTANPFDVSSLETEVMSFYPSATPTPRRPLPPPPGPARLLTPRHWIKHFLPRAS